MVEKIKDLCKRNNMSVAALEKAAKLGGGSISRWDTSMPSIDKVIRVAEVFGLTVNDLAYENPPKAPYLTDKEQFLLETFRGLNEEGQRRLLEQARFFSSAPEYSYNYIKNTDSTINAKEA